jgi:RpiB/LacA/LacB family sugar-phosphate isomerase
LKIAVASDHAGYALKKDVMPVVRKLGHRVVDLGTDSTQPVDYPDYAYKIGQAVLKGQAERGILICGSGVGASIAANKLPGIRAAVCHDTYSAHQGVEHDQMNILCLGARIIGLELAAELVTAFLNARFSGEARHKRRVAKITAIERGTL